VTIGFQTPHCIGLPSFDVMAQPVMMSPIPSSFISGPVWTAITPSIASAAEASMPLILACATGLRTKAA
jgi:hypothetical protein